MAQSYQRVSTRESGTMKNPSRSRAVMLVLEALIALAFAFAVLGTFSKLAGAQTRELSPDEMRCANFYLEPGGTAKTPRQTERYEDALRECSAQLSKRSASNTDGMWTVGVAILPRIWRWAGCLRNLRER
jgi:hypothetical protein